MYDKKQIIHYCTIFSDEQWDFILEGRFSLQRLKCLHRLMTDSVRAKTICNIKGIEIALEVGEVAASDVELADFLKCNRKTIGKLIDSFNRLGVLTTRTNNRTSIHTLHFLTGWYIDGVLLTNPHYVKPSANVKGQMDSKRTPYCHKKIRENGLSKMSDNRQCREMEMDNTETCAAVISSPFGSSILPDHIDCEQDGDKSTDYSHIIDKGSIFSDRNLAEVHTEAQDCKISNTDESDTETRD